MYRPLVGPGGVAGRNCDGLVSVNGVTVAYQGTAIGEKLGGGPGRKDGVGRHMPTSVLPMKTGGGRG